MEERELSEQPWPSAGMAWYAVAILVIAFIFSFVDRIIIGLLVEPIKQDLGVSDFGIGMLGGLAFAVFYALVGIPIGRLADRYSRRKIIGIGIFLWSLATAACGLAKNFWHLFLARVGVGVGEAALSPAAYSMIADFFPKEKLGRALGVYQAGAFVGAGILVPRWWSRDRLCDARRRSVSAHRRGSCTMAAGVLHCRIARRAGRAIDGDRHRTRATWGPRGA